MVNGNALIDSVLTLVCCLGAPLGVITVAAILGTRSRLNYARQLMEQYSSGAYKDWGKPSIANRFRLLLGLEILLFSASLLSFVLAILYQTTPYVLAVGIALAVVFGVGGAIVSTVLQNKVRRGKW